MGDLRYLHRSFIPVCVLNTSYTRTAGAISRAPGVSSGGALVVVCFRVTPDVLLFFPIPISHVGAYLFQPGPLRGCPSNVRSRRTSPPARSPPLPLCRLSCVLLVVVQGSCQRHCTQEESSASPDGVQATAVGPSLMGVVRQVLTCWSGTADVLVSSMSTFDAV